MNSKPISIGVQLYTLRDLCKTDMAGTLRELAAMGYQYVEVIDPGNLTLVELKDTLAKLNLKAPSHHANLATLQEKLSALITTCRTLGCEYVVCPWIAPEWRTADGYRKLAGIFNDVGRRLRDEAGVQLCYHHHDFEFQRFDGRYGLDILFEDTVARHFQLQIDTYWVKKGGADPAAYIRKYTGRVPLLHLKDMSADAKQTFAEVGTGTLDWPSIFSVAETAGVCYAFVEQDTCPVNPLDCVRLSLENLKKMGRV